MKQVIRWAPSVIVMVMIFFLSHQSGNNLNPILELFQSIVPTMRSFDWGHFVAYFVLAWTFLWGLGRTGFKYKLFVVALCVLYGITDEFHQSFVPGRTPELSDIRNDAIGAALAMLMASIPPISRWLKRWIPD